MDLHTLVKDADVAFEQQLQRSPHDLTSWLRYYWHKPTTDEKLFVLQRACYCLKRSYKLWALYLGHLVELSEQQRQQQSSAGWVAPAQWLAHVDTEFQQSLFLLHRMPLLWARYLGFLLEFQPDPTRVRRAFNSALRALPVTQHHIIWPLFLRFADQVGGLTGARVYLRYYKFRPEAIETVVERLAQFGQLPQCLQLYRTMLAQDQFVSQAGHSPLQLWLNYIDLLVRARGRASGLATPDQVDALVRRCMARFPDQKGELYTKLAAFYIRNHHYEKARDVYEDALASIITVKDFTMVYDSYAEFEESLTGRIAKRVEEAGITQVGEQPAGESQPANSQADNSQAVDSQAENSQADNSQAGDSQADNQPTEGPKHLEQPTGDSQGDSPGDSERNLADLSLQLDLHLARFERLINQRDFLLSDVKIRQNPNSVDEWLSRIQLIDPANLQLRLTTYVQAITTIDPLRATKGYSKLWINYSKIYEDNGDVSTARTILDKAIKVEFCDIDELVDIWIHWAEMELRHSDIATAIKVLKVATSTTPENEPISYTDASVSPQLRIFKSIRIWSFYLDLVESSGNLPATCSLYERVLQLKIATPLIIINYASFLEDNHRFEDAFKVYEKGLAIFKYPIAYEIWSIYLNKAIARGIHVERVRDLFDTCLETLPSEFLKPIVVLYSNFEFSKGSVKKSLRLLDNALDKLANADDKVEVLNLLISRTVEYSGLVSTRPIYQKAIEVLPLVKSLEFLLRFAQLELKLGEFQRVRELLKFASLKMSPGKIPQLWEFWYDFEVKHGSKETFKEMLRLKRQANDKFPEYNTEVLPGFVKASDQAPVSSVSKQPEPTSNPDEIELDI